MKAEKITIFLGVIIIILLAFLIISRAGIIGVSRGRLEQDARETQKVSGDWKMAQAVSEDICAMLFYDEEREQYKYSIYLTKEKMHYGYFFREGGSGYPNIGSSVQGIAFEHKGIVLMSLNKDKVSEIVTDNNGVEDRIQVDPLSPFAVILSIDCGEITMYDSSGQIVTLYHAYSE